MKVLQTGLPLEKVVLGFVPMWKITVAERLLAKRFFSDKLARVLICRVAQVFSNFIILPIWVDSDSNIMLQFFYFLGG